MNKTLLALIVSLAALTLVACGDKDDDTGSGDDSGSTEDSGS
jgi:hypothetical protein